MKLTRRGWNNVMIIGVISFIAIIQLPELIKAHLAKTSTPQAPQAHIISLLPANAHINQLRFRQHDIDLLPHGWRIRPSSQQAPETFVNHWQSLQGTEVLPEMLAKLKPLLTDPQTVEIGLVGHNEPARVTVYQLPKFWLMQNPQGKWLAISVDNGYLFP
ncbi:hypothetical protein [Photobacterium damselae]|uniref:hypothetical protein n=1 Tax=Photobacterium damselae TaxID=38293 RepID=UPI000D07A322|nr:hypothetical protein [Photobacterium damselae]MCG3816493.1 hypothetical protein [Photobacterium damselae]PSB88389.1 hypothetical protein C5F63_07590 [Photobacterium damselae subsp. damselae]SUB91316.1 Uncharacterised protein [Photobacterium damselae]